LVTGFEGRGRLRESGEHRRLGHRQLGERLAEVHFGGGRHPVGALAKKNNVEVGLQDLLFGKVVLHLQRQEDLLEFAGDVLVTRQEHVARSLHGDGAGALRIITGRQVDVNRTQHAEIIDTAVLEEPIILRRQEGFTHQRRNFLVAHRYAALLPDLRDEGAAPGVDAQRHLQGHGAHARFARERRGQVDIAREHRIHEAEQQHQADRAQTNQRSQRAGLHLLVLRLLRCAVGHAELRGWTACHHASAGPTRDLNRFRQLPRTKFVRLLTSI